MSATKADEFASVMNKLFTSWSTASYVPDKTTTKLLSLKILNLLS